MNSIVWLQKDSLFNSTKKHSLIHRFKLPLQLFISIFVSSCTTVFALTSLKRYTLININCKVRLIES